MQELLINAGLTEAQAAAYLFLLEHGESAPPALTANLKITRSNAYKVLDSLDELGLASKHEVRKKFVYRAADPTALSSLVAEKRNDIIALEQHIRSAMQELRASYQKSSGTTTSVEVLDGKKAMTDSYEQQASGKNPIHFIKSRADIPFMGFETMDRVRRLSSNYDTPRFGITPDAAEGPNALEIDARTNLTRTWVGSEAYTSPVEWAVSGNDLLIQVFDGDGRVIRISDYEVAESFRQLWQIMDKSLRAGPGYKKLPRQANRNL